ncbi:MAG: hydrogenase maturation protease [Nitrospirae bacterium]|nr:hydrogenase maturation protease [Nitrospirota bacterium]
MQEIKKKTIIIGLGNPIVSDDGVGIKAVRILSETIKDDAITFKEIYIGGMQLMEAMVGYDRALIIDAIAAGGVVGSFYELALSDISRSRNSYSSHDTDLLSAIDLGRMAGLLLPNDIKFWAIEVKDVITFSEGLTEEVQNALPDFIKVIAQDLLDGEI